MNSLTITQAAKLIAEAVQNGSATFEEASEMQKAIREKRYYGNTMTNETRARMMVNRFGFFAI
jgi:hypothetical protein